MSNLTTKKIALSDIKYDILNVSEKAAINCYDFIGKGDEKAADLAAVDSMRSSLNALPINGLVVIGEGERDEAPMLYIGEEVGRGGIEVDIALDPLEGTTICAHNARGSMAVIAVSEKNCLLQAPDVYMDKIAISGKLSEANIDLDNDVNTNIFNLAKYKNCSVEELNIIILNRPRHKDLIRKVRETGAKIELITDGDIAAVINVANPEYKADMYIGSGGAPEGVLAAAALQVLGGDLQGRLLFQNEMQKERALKMGIGEPDKKFSLNELARGNIIFCATGVTEGNLLNGVKKLGNSFVTESLLLDNSNGIIQKIRTHHNSF